MTRLRLALACSLSLVACGGITESPQRTVPPADSTSSGGSSAGSPDTPGKPGGAGSAGAPSIDVCSTKSACEEELLADTVVDPRRLERSGSWLYLESSFGLSLSRLPLAGGNLEHVASNAAWFGVDEQALFLLTQPSWATHSFGRFTLAGASVELLTELKGIAASNASILIDETSLYFAHYSYPAGLNGIFRLSKHATEGALESVANDLLDATTPGAKAELVALDATHLYFVLRAFSSEERLVRLPKAGGAKQVLTTFSATEVPYGELTHTSFFVDTTHVYFAEHLTGKVDEPWGRVLRVAKDHASPVEEVVPKQYVEVEHHLTSEAHFFRTLDPDGTRRLYRSGKLLFAQPGKWLGVDESGAYFAVRHSFEQYEDEYRLVRRKLCTCP